MNGADRPPPDPASLRPDFDQLAANVLLTVQAVYALQAAFDRKFTR